jgi:hypothetical protein
MEPRTTPTTLPGSLVRRGTIDGAHHVRARSTTPIKEGEKKGPSGRE